MDRNNAAVAIYEKALGFCMKYEKTRSELHWAKTVSFAGMDEISFFKEYVWVVLNSGFRYQVARKFFGRFIESGEKGSVLSPENCDLEQLINNRKKRAAIAECQKRYKEWFERLASIKDTENIIEFLDSLPYIGSVTRYHLARNLGFDFAKPDRHVKRLAKDLGFGNSDREAIELCASIAKQSGDRGRNSRCIT